MTAQLGEGLTRRKRPRDAGIGGISLDLAPAEGDEAKKARPDEGLGKPAVAATASKAVADIPGADLPPVLAPPGR